jgi:hypothetical protein
MCNTKVKRYLLFNATKMLLMRVTYVELHYNFLINKVSVAVFLYSVS